MGLRGDGTAGKSPSVVVVTQLIDSRKRASEPRVRKIPRKGEVSEENNETIKGDMGLMRRLWSGRKREER